MVAADAPGSWCPCTMLVSRAQVDFYLFLPVSTCAILSMSRQLKHQYRRMLWQAVLGPPQSQYWAMLHAFCIVGPGLICL